MTLKDMASSAPSANCRNHNIEHESELDQDAKTRSYSLALMAKDREDRTISMCYLL